MDLENNMLYTFGDSASFGSKFYLEGMSLDESKKRAWPYLLSKKLNQELVDFSFPGASNWRIARKIQNLDLKPEDIVAIQWTNSYRFEMGVTDEAVYNEEPNTHEDTESRLKKMLDCFEDDDGCRVKSMCVGLVDATSDPYVRQFMSMAYESFFSYKWFDDMFKVMLSSCCYNLDKSGCRYLMFDGWITPCYANEFRDIKQYVFRDTTLGNMKRGYSGTLLPDKTYPNEMENMFAADLIYKKYMELYENQNEDESVYIPELLRKYANENK